MQQLNVSFLLYKFTITIKMSKIKLTQWSRFCLFDFVEYREQLIRLCAKDSFTNEKTWDINLEQIIWNVHTYLQKKNTVLAYWTNENCSQTWPAHANHDTSLCNCHIQLKKNNIYNSPVLWIKSCQFKTHCHVKNNKTQFKELVHQKWKLFHNLLTLKPS